MTENWDGYVNIGDENGGWIIPKRLERPFEEQLKQLRYQALLETARLIGAQRLIDRCLEDD